MGNDPDKNSVAERSDDFIKIRSDSLSEAMISKSILARIGRWHVRRCMTPFSQQNDSGNHNKPPASANATPNEVTRPISTSGAKLEVISAPNPTIVVRFD